MIVMTIFTINLVLVLVDLDDIAIDEILQVPIKFFKKYKIPTQNIFVKNNRI
jgi:hypothetical protein